MRFSFYQPSLHRRPYVLIAAYVVSPADAVTVQTDHASHPGNSERRCRSSVPVQHANRRNIKLHTEDSGQFDSDKWHAHVLQVAAGAKPGSKSSGTALSHFGRYCTDIGYSVPTHAALDPLERPADGSPGLGRLFDFVGWLWDERSISPATTRGYVSTVRAHFYTMRGWRFLESPLLAKFLLREAQRPTSDEKRFRFPATKRLIQLVAADETIAIGTRAAILTAWDGMLRASEYCSSGASTFTKDATLLGKHVTWSKTVGGWKLFIAHSKGDRYNQGKDMFFVPRTDGDSYCAARALRFYYESEERACAAPDRPFFCKRDRHNAVSYVTRDNVSAALKRHAAAAGLPVDRISSHSIRIGAAFSMANGKVDWNTIIHRGRWSPESGARMVIMYARMSRERLQEGTDALAIDGATHDLPLLSRYA